jgi:hypothetical protein
MQRVLSGIDNKVIVDQAVARNALPILPLGGQALGQAKGGQ